MSRLLLFLLATILTPRGFWSLPVSPVEPLLAVPPKGTGLSGRPADGDWSFVGLVDPVWSLCCGPGREPRALAKGEEGVVVLVPLLLELVEPLPNVSFSNRAISSAGACL